MESELAACEDWYQELHEQLDEGLSPARTTELARHLASCAACREFAARLQVANEAMLLFAASRAAPATDKVLRNGVLNSVEPRAERTASQAPSPPWWRRITGDLSWARLSACTALACIAIGVWGLIKNDVVIERGGGRDAFRSYNHGLFFERSDRLRDEPTSHSEATVRHRNTRPESLVPSAKSLGLPPLAERDGGMDCDISRPMSSKSGGDAQVSERSVRQDCDRPGPIGPARTQDQHNIERRRVGLEPDPPPIDPSLHQADNGDRRVVSSPLPHEPRRAASGPPELQPLEPKR